jgi:GT2 family glycosyltransferase
VTGPTNQTDANATSSPPTTVSAVVVNYNGGNRLLNTLRSLDDQPYPLVEVLLLDNASDDGSLQRVRDRFPRVRIVDLGSNLGPAVARSRGIREARADLVLLLDSDVCVDQATLPLLVEAYHVEAKPAVVCPRVRLIPERDTVQAEGADAHFLSMMLLRHAYQPVETLPMTRAEVGGAISAALLVDRQRCLEAGAFDGLFTIYQEDLEFSIRLRVLGERFVCEPRAVVWHDRGTLSGLTFRGVGSYPRQRGYLSMRHRLLIVLVHYRLRTLVLLLPVLLLYELASIGICAVRGLLFEYFRAWKWVLEQLGPIRHRRRQVQRRRKLNDRDIYIGGPIPLTPGFIRNKPAAALVGGLSAVMNGYWHLVRRWIG